MNPFLYNNKPASQIVTFKRFCRDFSFSWANMNSARVRDNGLISSVDGKTVTLKNNYWKAKSTRSNDGTTASLEYNLNQHSCNNVGFSISLDPNMADWNIAGNIHWETDKNPNFGRENIVSVWYDVKTWHGSLETGKVYYWMPLVEKNGVIIRGPIQEIR